MRTKPIEDYRIIDDLFMNLFFDGDNVVTALVLRIILAEPELNVSYVRKQEQLENPGHRSVTLDVRADGTEGSRHNIEMQRDLAEASPKRARYHSSLMDTKMLAPQEELDKLNDSYVIFVTEGDARGDGQLINRYEMIDLDNGRKFGDGRHIIYVNSTYVDDQTDLGKLVHDFLCKDPNDMYYEVLANKMRYLKETKEGRAKMYSEIERIREEGMEEGREERSIELAMKAISMGTMSLEEISDFFELPLSTVMQLSEPKAV